MQRAIPHRLSAIARSATALLAAIAAPSFASTSGVVISQVYGANGNTYASDYVELFNAGSAAVSVSGWSIQYTSATGAGNFLNGSTNITGTIQPGQYWLVKLNTTTGTALPTPDFTGTSDLSGSAGKVALVNQTATLGCNGGSATCTADQLSHIVDLVGYGTANFSETSPAPTLTKTTALFRANGGCTDTGNNAGDFTLGAPAPRTSVTTPAPCAGGSTPTPPAPPAPAPSPTPSAKAIYQIQGSGATSPFVGQVVTTSGVVTKVDNNGFFMQDLTGDNNPATSDGIFVFTSTAPTVSVGQMAQVTATVQEFNVGAATNADTLAHTVTELSTVTSVVVTGSGYSVAPVVVTLPLAAGDSLERFEGMLVTLTGPLTVQQNYFLGRFGELTLATGGRVWTPTNVYRPGAQANALNAANLARSILLDDGTTVQNPTPTPYLGQDNTVRAGDTTASITGVIDYGLATSANTDPGSYKIHPTQAVAFARANPRTTQADDVSGNIRVGSANIENFFTTLDDGTNKCPPSNTADDCRGANTPLEFSRQEAKVVEELAGMNADAVALMELQNNGTVAIQNLVNALNARLGATLYAAVPDAATGGGTDAIKVGMIYKPSRLSLVGAALSDTAAINNRAPMAQVFAAANGEKFILVANHLKSKGCSDFTAGPGDADSGDGQGCFNARRVQQADELRSFVAQVQSQRGVVDTLLAGDFNAYAQEDPVADLTSNGFVDQVGRYLDKPGAGSWGYSYVFNGSSGRLDQALASNTLSPKVSGVTEWHINADEPLVIDYNTEFKGTCSGCGPDYYSATAYRASDHDPIVVGLNLVHVINGTAGADTIVGTAGDDVITGGAGADRLTGNGGRDVFVYTSIRDAGDTITDFTPNDDRIDLGALLATLGTTPANAVAGGYVSLQSSGNNTLVMIDSDGSAGAAIPKAFITLLNVSPANIDVTRDLGLGTPAAVNAAIKTSAKAATAHVATKTK